MLLEEDPRQQLLMGVFLLLAGIALFPAMLAVLMPLVKYMNSGWSDANWWQAGWRLTKGFMVFACGWFAILGAGKVLVYSCVKAGLLDNPWS